MLDIRNVCKKAGDFSLCDISVEVKKGDYFVLLGVSGSGKSMLLELIAGLNHPDLGEIFLDNKDITYSKIQSRQTGIVFQDSAVFPHMTVYDNVAFPLKNRSLSRTEIADTVDKWAQLTGITSLLKRRPAKLSGGEQRRVALARTLAMNPKILLLDEPLSSLDVLLQYELMQLLSKIHDEGQTVMHVTHDYLEAYALATRLAVMQEGRIIQQGTTSEVFSKPGNAFVASLTGIKNYFQCLEGNMRASKYFVTPAMGVSWIASQPVGAGAFFYVRKEEILINATTEMPNKFEAFIAGVFPFPGGADVMLDAGIILNAHLTDEHWDSLNLRKGDRVSVCFPAEAIVPV